MDTEVSNKNDLSFLKKQELSKTIEDSIQYIQIILAESEKHGSDLYKLVNFMKNNELMKEQTAEELLKINDIRNTFHFTKPRDKITCEIKTVEKAFKLLVEIIEGGESTINFKKN